MLPCPILITRASILDVDTILLMWRPWTVSAMRVTGTGQLMHAAGVRRPQNIRSCGVILV